MKETDKYLFDLQGYLVIEDVLNEGEIAAFDPLLDQNEMPAGDSFRFGSAAGSFASGPGFLSWGQPFCDLLDHARIMPILRFVLGDCFRLDRLYGLRMVKGSPAGPIHSDYGASRITSNAEAGRFHPFKDNEIINGFVVVAWSLAAAGPEYGGFCCIPGSHKSNYKLPEEYFEAGEQAPCVVVPKAPAGSVIIFSEALTHGTATWTADHERKTILYKYCVSQMAWSSNRVRPPDNIELTARQKILLREPADPHRFFPSLFADAE